MIALIEQLPKDQQIWFLGDLIDRGPESKKVLDYVLKNHNSIIGNHEEMFMGDQRMWMANGGQPSQFTSEEFGEYTRLINEKMPIYKIFEDIKINGRKLILVHGGLHNLDINKSAQSGLMTWVRYEQIDHPEYFQVNGHTPLREVYIDDYHTNIDTGCVFGRTLTGLQVPEIEVFQQKFID